MKVDGEAIEMGNYTLCGYNCSRRRVSDQDDFVDGQELRLLSMSQFNSVVCIEVEIEKEETR